MRDGVAPVRAAVVLRNAPKKPGEWADGDVIHFRDQVGEPKLVAELMMVLCDDGRHYAVPNGAGTMRLLPVGSVVGIAMDDRTDDHMAWELALKATAAEIHKAQARYSAVVDACPPIIVDGLRERLLVEARAKLEGLSRGQTQGTAEGEAALPQEQAQEEGQPPAP